ncbi:MAG: single-stranded-DNA-specific exonuclease RecJ [Alphaproteobacteria bacterium]
MKTINGCIVKQIEANERLVETMMQRYGISFALAQILSQKEVGLDEVSSFLEPKIANLMPNPNSLMGMDNASSRIAQAIKNKEKIAILGDYDVDGATSTALMKLFLRGHGIEPLIHIPDREEGYGPSIKAVDEFVLGEATLIITVDCGTTAFEPLEYAAGKGIDLIVLDHHAAEITLPKCYEVVNPKRLDDESCLTYLAACGVVFMTLVAVNAKLETKTNLLELLDIVALGTVCDVVPLVGLNRAFVKQGLKVMGQYKNFGLKALREISGITDALTTYHLGFVLGPRINATGRVGDAKYGNHLLCAKDDLEAKILAEKLNNFNIERKEIEAYCFMQAIEQLESQPQDVPFAFVYGHDWHQGVIGIVAGKLKERYNQPTFVMTLEGEEYKGSARSIAGLDLGNLIINAKEKGLLLHGGGHIMAAGFSVSPEKIDEFKNFIKEYVLEHLGQDVIEPIIEINAILDVKGINLNLLEEFERLEPYGASNPEPKFLIKSAHVSGASIVGQGHIKCFLSSLNGGSLKAIAFKMADTELGKQMLANSRGVFDLVGVVRKNVWQGRESVQFIIEDAILN